MTEQQNNQTAALVRFYDELVQRAKESVEYLPPTEDIVAKGVSGVRYFDEARRAHFLKLRYSLNGVQHEVVLRELSTEQVERQGHTVEAVRRSIAVKLANKMLEQWGPL